MQPHKSILTCWFSHFSIICLVILFFAMQILSHPFFANLLEIKSHEYSSSLNKISSFGGWRMDGRWKIKEKNPWADDISHSRLISLENFARKKCREENSSLCCHQYFSSRWILVHEQKFELLRSIFIESMLEVLPNKSEAKSFLASASILLMNL